MVHLLDSAGGGAPQVGGQGSRDHAVNGGRGCGYGGDHRMNGEGMQPGWDMARGI